MIRAASGIVLAGQAVRVAAAVVALVGGAHHDPDFGAVAADAVEHLLALDGVGLHDGPLLGVELAGLVDDRVGDVDLADVVQQRPKLGLLPALLREAHVVGDARGQLHHVLGVVAGVLVVVLEQLSQQQRRAAVGAAELDRLGDARVALAGEDATAGSPAGRRTARPRGGRQRRSRRGCRRARAAARSRRRGCRPGRAPTSPCRWRAARAAAADVHEGLGHEGEGIGRQRVPGGKLRVKRDQHKHRGEREQRVRQGGQEQPVGRALAADHAERLGEQQRERDQQRNQRRRQQQQHGEDDQPDGRLAGVVDGEADAGDAGEQHDEQHRHRQREGARAGSANSAMVIAAARNGSAKAASTASSRRVNGRCRRSCGVSGAATVGRARA